MKKKFITLLFILLVFLIVSSYLTYKGYMWPNKIFASRFSVLGIDVSHHQENIDWLAVKEEDISFAFIKATEGKDFVDHLFQYNWEQADQANLLRGAYHFYTFNSSGEEQANNFIRSVPKEENMLPPVVDLEFDGNSENVPSKEALQKELEIFIAKIEQHYNMKPILYLTYDSYETYIQGDFVDYPIWIRDIILFPRIDDKRNWTFWQFSNRGRIEGIDNYVDLNVFYGNMNEWKELLDRNNE